MVAAALEGEDLAVDPAALQESKALRSMSPWVEEAQLEEAVVAHREPLGPLGAVAQVGGAPWAFHQRSCSTWRRFGQSEEK